MPKPLPRPYQARTKLPPLQLVATGDVENVMLRHFLLGGGWDEKVNRDITFKGLRRHFRYGLPNVLEFWFILCPIKYLLQRLHHERCSTPTVLTFPPLSSCSPCSVCSSCDVRFWGGRSRCHNSSSNMLQQQQQQQP